MSLLFAAAVIAAQAGANVGFAELMRGEEAAAIAIIAADQTQASDDPAKLINLAIAHARRGETDLARRHFQAVIDQRQITELQTSTGRWLDARTIARQGLGMLDQGTFTTNNRFARN